MAKKTHYGRAIRAMRVARNLTAAQLGRKCRPKLAERQVTYMEGQASIQVHKLDAIARALGLTLTDLIEFARKEVAV